MIPLGIFRFAQALRDRWGAERVLLFGSRARAQQRPDSDYDFIIVSPRFEGMHRRARSWGLREIFYEAAERAPIDVICLTPEEFEQARSGIDDRTPLVEASQAFNAAAVALEMSWLHLFADAGCLGDEQQKQAAEAVRTYTLALQQSLQQAGYYDAEVDGVYGPATVAAVESLQEAHGLPVTGTVDKATAEALQADVLAAGGQAAQAELSQLQVPTRPGPRRAWRRGARRLALLVGPRAWLWGLRQFFG